MIGAATEAPEGPVVIEPDSSVRRPNTVSPSSDSFTVLDGKSLLKMTNDQLLKFADEVLGLPLKKGTSRNTIITKIVNSAVFSKESV